MPAEEFTFRYYLNLGQGRFADILVDQFTDPYVEAVILAKKYDFSNEVKNAIANSIKEQIIYEKNELSKKQSKVSSQLNDLSKTCQSVKNSKQNIIKESSQTTRKKHQKSVMKIKKYITQAANQQQLDNNINTLERSNIGSKKQQQKQYQNQNQNRSKKQKQNNSFFVCQTQPKFQTIPCSPQDKDLLKLRIDKLLQRQSSKQNSRVSEHRSSVFQNLYKKHKEIEKKKQIKRKQSQDSITFKPEINKLSKKIVQDSRRNKLWSVKNSLQKQTPKKLSTQNSIKNISTINNSVHGKKQIFFKVCEGSQDQKTPQKIKILPKSEQLVQKCRKQALKQIFDELLICRKNVQKRLFFSDINFSKLTQKQKLLLPIFQQLKHFTFGINQAQFIEGCLKFMQNLPQSDKIILGSKKKSCNKENSIKTYSRVNSSKKLKTQVFQANFSSVLKDKLNIYQRGNIYQKKSAQKLSKIKQNESNQIMKNCTFRPTINPQKQK